MRFSNCMCLSYTPLSKTKFCSTLDKHWIKPLSKRQQGNWVFATNYDFTIAISFQPDCVNLWYFKLSLFDLKWFIVEKSKVSEIQMQRYKDKKIRACDKNSIPLGLVRNCMLCFWIEFLSYIFSYFLYFCS